MFHRWGDVTPVIKWKVTLWWNGHTRPRRLCSNAAPPRWFTAEHTFPPPFSWRPPSWPQPASAPLNRSKSFVSTSNFKVVVYRSKTIWIVLETEVRKHNSFNREGKKSTALLGWPRKMYTLDRMHNSTEYPRSLFHFTKRVVYKIGQDFLDVQYSTGIFFIFSSVGKGDLHSW